ncbi:hypothetical protein Mterra_02826 [Calidithermus terrae]|uniref:Uncharacterized protein n=1 Tax=Calidithermus terrae TaxID=1408545 RepID=A0A399EDR0_9DEIN|nr:hypothetical protein Mterra_02826 [Calidithermus terrae]
MAVQILTAGRRQNGAVPTLQRLLPRFLYVYVRGPVIPIPVVLFIPTLVLEGLVYLAEALAGRWSQGAAYYLEQARTGLRLIRHQGPLTVVDVELQDVARFQAGGASLGGPRGPVRVKVGQW